MSKGRDRYDGWCPYCLGETAFPTALYTEWPNNVGLNVYREGIVWTCIICGEEMFWSVKKTSLSVDCKFEWVHWELRGMGSEAPMDKWNTADKAVLLQGIWFQKKKIGWKWGDSWSPIKGIDCEKLPKHRH